MLVVGVGSETTTGDRSKNYALVIIYFHEKHWISGIYLVVRIYLNKNKFTFYIPQN